MQGLDLEFRVYQIRWQISGAVLYMATLLNERPHVRVILDERELTYGCKKGERKTNF